MSNNTIHIHYALQTCDLKSWQGQKRFASDDRTEISKKCIKSFFDSIKWCADRNQNVIHTIAIVQDKLSVDLENFILKIKDLFTCDQIKIVIIKLEKSTGISASISECYHWLQNNGIDLVYQVQDDYLFEKQAINDMIDIFFQILNEMGVQSLISPYNDSHNWLGQYRNKVTPRTLIVGKTRYWIQFYDCSCSFLTSYNQFIQHWDLYNMFLYLIDKKMYDDNAIILENRSLNYMLTQRNVFGLIPINSLAFHMQSEIEKDPHIDYKLLWDSINIL